MNIRTKEKMNVRTKQKMTIRTKLLAKLRALVQRLRLIFPGSRIKGSHSLPEK